MRKRSLAFILIFLMVSVNLSNTEYVPLEYFEDQNNSTEVSPNNTSNRIEVDMAFLGPFSERMGATYGTGYRAAADIAIEHMNEKQTKYEFGYNLYDTVGGTLGNCDAYAARAAAQEILDDDLEMVIGPMCSFVEEVDDVFNWITDDMEEDIKIYSPSGVSIISPIQYNNNHDVFGFQPFTWGETYANALSDNGISTPALVYTDDDYGRDFIDSFKSAWEESGGSYCLSVGYGATPTSEEFVNIVTAIHDAGCDSIVLGSHMADGANILSYHSAQDQGSELPIFASDGICEEGLFEQGWLLSELSNNLTLLGDAMSIGCARYVQNNSMDDSLRSQEFSADCANSSNCRDRSIGNWELNDENNAMAIYDAFTIMMESYILSQIENITLNEAIQLVGYGWEGASGEITFHDEYRGVIFPHGGMYESCTFDVHATIVDENYSNEGSSLLCESVSASYPPLTLDNELYGFDVFADSDGDGILDISDVCEGHDDSFDLDQDGIADGCDDFIDTDGDGLEDNVDVFPNDANETMDSDMDGVGDNADAFPNDANETMDSDMDGVGDNADAFPNDANETMDSDMDGIGDNAEVNPSDGSETVDSGGNQTGVNNDVDEGNSSSVPGFTGILGIMALLGAAFIRRKD